jgi:hypothetical protein
MHVIVIVAVTHRAASHPDLPPLSRLARRL